ncbi:MAG TPA: glycerol-3-phosphate 1-O-acyltransferase [Gammaproteobacteria bacterium]|nr:glycerol-3-phosphate 1-O-acyltransferase [Gammaproteobacteria bacterium]
MLLTVSLVLFAYLLGSLSSAIIMCRLFSLPDPRSQGSGNPGATNVLRFGGKKIAIMVLTGDILKGLIPVLVATYAGLTPAGIALVGVAAFLGHLYPVFFGFQGGKGVATALGVLLGMSWLLGLAIIATWLIMAMIFRISSLSAITAAIAAPFFTWLLQPDPTAIAAVSTMALLLLLRHKRNIQNLLQGTEPRIGEK